MICAALREYRLLDGGPACRAIGADGCLWGWSRLGYAPTYCAHSPLFLAYGLPGCGIWWSGCRGGMR